MTEYVHIIVPAPPQIVRILTPPPIPNIRVIYQNVIQTVIQTVGIQQDSVYDELLTGAVDNSNVSFSTQLPFSNIRVYYNGQRLRQSDDYIVNTTTQIILNYAPKKGVITADYIKL